MVIVPRQVLPVDEEVVVLVKLPEFAVDDVEVLVAEEVGDLVDVLLLETRAALDQVEEHFPPSIALISVFASQMAPLGFIFPLFLSLLEQVTSWLRIIPVQTEKAPITLLGTGLEPMIS